VTGSKDKTCRVWDTSVFNEDASSSVQQACIAIAQGHTEPVGAVAIAHNSATYLSHKAFIVSGAGDKILKRWSLPVHLVGKSSGDSEYVMPLSPSHSLRAHEKDINCLAISPNDQIIASASQDKTIKLWSGSDLSAVATLTGHKRGVWKVRFSPVDKVLLSCSGDRTVKLWSLQDFSIIRTLEGHTASVLNAIFINHATQIVSSSSDGLLRLWTIRSGECVRTMEDHQDRVWALQSLPLTEQEKKEQQDLSRENDIKRAAREMDVDDQDETDEAPSENLATAQTSEEEVFAEQLYFFSAGSDARVILWKDATAEEESQRLQEAEEVLLVEQSLVNDLRQQRYTLALRKAMKLRQPFRILSILTSILDQIGKSAPSSDSSFNAPEQSLDDILLELMTSGMKKSSDSENDAEDNSEQGEKLLMQLVDYAKEWNTNAKNCFVAQTLFQSIFRLMSTDKLARWPAIRENIAGLVAYTERHFQRASRLREASYLLDYVVRQITGMLPLESLREQQRQELSPNRTANQLVAVPADANPSEDLTDKDEENHDKEELEPVEPAKGMQTKNDTNTVDAGANYGSKSASKRKRSNSAVHDVEEPAAVVTSNKRSRNKK
jgi:U3 small nucleolar RNA-associated protein 13